MVELLYDTTGCDDRVAAVGTLHPAYMNRQRALSMQYTVRDRYALTCRVGNRRLASRDVVPCLRVKHQAPVAKNSNHDRSRSTTGRDDLLSAWIASAS